MTSSTFEGDIGTSSRPFESFSSYVEDDDDDESSVNEVVDRHDSPYNAGDDTVFVSQPTPERSGNGPILPPPEVLLPEEGLALRDWRRQNAIRLEEKEKREKEILKEIIEEADEYKAEYYRKWKLRCENNWAANREKEKLFLESQEKFHAEASKNYWKATAELIPKEVPAIEKKGKKKDQEKKAAIVVIHGPKPGKPTDLSRMRQVLVKLKHNPPTRMNAPSPSPSDPRKDAKGESIPPPGNDPTKSQATAEPGSLSTVGN